MKMNIGTETRTGSIATPPHMRSSTLERLLIGKTPSSQPMKPNASPMPPITNATG